jgi:hypothetical protein
MGPRPEPLSGNEAHVSAGDVSLTPSQIADDAQYSAQFAAVLADRNAHPAGAANRITLVRPRLGLAPDDSQHLPALMAAALGCLLMAGTGSALWYAVLGIAPREAATGSEMIVAAPNNRPLDAAAPAPALLPTALIAGETPVPGETLQRAASPLGPDEWSIRQVWLPAAANPAPAQPAVIAIETAAVPAQAPGPEMVAAQPTTDTAVQVAALPDATSTDPSGAVQLTGLRAAGDAADQTPDATDLPVKTSDGNGKSPPAYGFVDPYPEKPASGLSSITTASRAGAGAAKGDDKAATGKSGSSGSGGAGSGSTGKHDSKGTKGDKGSRDNGSGDAGKDKGKDDRGKGHADKDNGGKGHGDKDKGGKGNGKGSD